MKRVLFAAGLVVILSIYAAPVRAFETSPIGWASVADTNGTPYDVNGGEGGTVVTVTDDANFIYYASTTSSSAKYIIQVLGTITLPGPPHVTNVKSNRSVIGIGSNPTIYGSLKISSGYSNIIIRNLNINYNGAEGSSDPCTDGISIQGGAHNIWIDHCNLYNSPDGLIDMTDQSDFITVSWCKFYYEAGIYNTAHHFTNLIGGDDEDYDDRGKLNITMHHNWWGSGCKERMPRVRFGHVHVFNNYYSNLVSGGYCVGVGVDCNILLENNYFYGPLTAWKNYSGTPQTGRIGWNTGATGNQFVSCSIPSGWTNYYATMFVPPYSYTMDSGASINTIVQNGAGTNKLNPSPNPMTFSVAPYGLDSHSIAMTATTATCADGVEYFFDCTTPGGHDSGWQDSNSYTDTSLTPDTNYTYTVQARNQTQPLFVGAASSPASATTLLYCTSPITSDFDDNCQVDFFDYAILADEWVGDQLDWLDMQELAEDWLTCNRDPSSECWQ